MTRCREQEAAEQTASERVAAGTGTCRLVVTALP
jgi:hypothetical protein